MEDHEWIITDVLLDTHAHIQTLDRLRAESGFNPKLNRALLKLRDVYGDLNGLPTTPLSLPPHQSA